MDVIHWIPSSVDEPQGPPGLEGGSSDRDPSDLDLLPS